MGRRGDGEMGRRGDAGTRGRGDEEDKGDKRDKGDKGDISHSPIPNSQFPIPNSQTTNNKQQTTNNQKQTTNLLPVPYSPPSAPALFSPRPRWRNSGRAQQRRPLKPPKFRGSKFIRLWLIEIGSAIAGFLLLRFLVSFLMETTNLLLVRLPMVRPWQLFYRDPTLTLLVLLVILLLSSPWLIDWLLKWFHGLEPLSLNQLASRNPEAARVVQRFCRHKRLPLTKLGILPTDAPVAMSYGNLPRTARLVVSEGLLEQLADDEVATICAGELGHIFHWDFVLMSLGVLILQVPYTIYWLVAQGGERLPSLMESKLPAYEQWLTPILVNLMGAVAAVSYGCYWLLRLPLLWFSRVRIYYSDHIAVETTGNPNGLTRGLLKIGLGISEYIQDNCQTSRLLESFDLLLPVGYQQSIIFSSCSPQTSFEAVLDWDCKNPYRHWLIFNASHPLFGERLHLCSRYVRFWMLNPELDVPTPTPPIRDNGQQLSKLKNSYKAFPLLQSALLAGLVLGILLRVTFWLIGKIADWLDIWRLIWLHNAQSFLDACVLVAFCLGIFILFNRYFPEIKLANLHNEPDLGDYCSTNTLLPTHSQPVRLAGKLLGRSGLLNWLEMDLILQTSTGLIKLHSFSYLGPFGNLLPFCKLCSLAHLVIYLGQLATTAISRNQLGSIFSWNLFLVVVGVLIIFLLPQPGSAKQLVNHQVTVTGWFRRGVTPWIDVDTISTIDGEVIRANYPLWVTILGVMAVLWGAYLISQVGA
ncbi:MAG: M48 family metalloprotease [Symploca sp. SIO2E6]|nr:M48 family metalloprotease [Symploca sp. SIO2E6]